jgi:hypothetical protein
MDIFFIWDRKRPPATSRKAESQRTLLCSCHISLQRGARQKDPAIWIPVFTTKDRFVIDEILLCHLMESTIREDKSKKIRNQSHKHHCANINNHLSSKHIIKNRGLVRV